ARRPAFGSTMRLGKRILEQLALGHPVQPVSVRSSFAITHILSRIRRITVWLGGPSLVAVAYFAGAEAAFYIGTLSDQIFALFWPPNVVLFCALVVVPQRDWWLYIAAAFPAHAIAEFGVGVP